MESKKINQLATELTPALSDLTIIGDPTTGISKKITLSQMASLFTGTVEEYATKTAFPLVGVADTIYIALDTNVLWRWDTGTNAYVELSPNIINSLVFNDANGFDGTISLVGSVATLTITTALTTGSVGFIGASGALVQDNANFFWDDTNNRLGIGTNAPTTSIDTFGSGIITRVNGTSTNNAFIGFASAGTNKWSVGNVQSDHRFRIYNEATTSELVSVLQTGEFGIGISNPTTKLHIDGGASALIANLDANVSVAKSVSFRSDNSNRINIEVSGTESGSNAGANFFLRTYTDAGALIETPLSIVRSTGVTTIKSLTLTNALSIANGGTGSTTQNFVDLTTAQTIAGAKTFSDNILLSGTGQRSLTVRSNTSGDALLILEASGVNGGNIRYTRSTSELILANNVVDALKIGAFGVASFSSSVITADAITVNMAAGNYPRFISTVGAKSWEIGYRSGTTNYEIREDGTTRFLIANGGTSRFLGDVELNGGTGTRTLTIQSNTSGDAVLALLAAGSNGGSIKYTRSTNEIIFNNNSIDALKISGSGAATFNNTINVIGASGGNSITVSQGISIGDGYGLNAGNFQIGAITSNRFYIYNGTLGIDNVSIVPSTGVTTFNRGVNVLNGQLRVGTNGTAMPNALLSVGTGGFGAFGVMTQGQGAGTWDTGISINQTNAGMAALLMASTHTSDGTATQSALYLINFFYDGNNTPSTVFIAGSNFLTFGKSGSNTLTITASGIALVQYALMSNS